MKGKLPKPPRGATKAFKTYWQQLGTLLEGEGRLNEVNLNALTQLVLRVVRDEYGGTVNTDGYILKTSQGMTAQPLLAHVKACDNTICRMKANMGFQGKKPALSPASDWPPTRS